MNVVVESENNMKARRIGVVAGSPVFLFPVQVTFGEAAVVLQRNIYPKRQVRVIARNAREAADLIHDEVRSQPCVEIEVFGPRGGVAAHRYHGYESAIWNQMCDDSDRRAALARQMALSF